MGTLYSACNSPKRALVSLKLELQMVMSYLLWVLETSSLIPTCQPFCQVFYTYLIVQEQQPTSLTLLLRNWEEEVWSSRRCLTLKWLVPLPWKSNHLPQPHLLYVVQSLALFLIARGALHVSGTVSGLDSPAMYSTLKSNKTKQNKPQQQQQKKKGGGAT